MNLNDYVIHVDKMDMRCKLPILLYLSHNLDDTNIDYIYTAVDHLLLIKVIEMLLELSVINKHRKHSEHTVYCVKIARCCSFCCVDASSSSNLLRSSS